MPTTQKATSKPAGKKLSKAAQAKVAAVLGKDALENEAAHAITPEQRNAERRIDPMSFAVQQLSAPVAPTLSTPPQLTDAFKAELAALQAKHGVPPTTVKISMPKAEKIVQNGMTRPAVETLCGKIWAAADELSAQSHGVATIAALKLHADCESVNEHTIKTQYARWRQFNGISGRLPKIHAVHQTPGEYEGLAKAE